MILCLLAVLSLLCAAVVGGTLVCLIFAIIGITMLAGVFAYFNLFFLSSVSLLAYAGFFIVLFLVAKKYIPENVKSLKTLLLFIFGAAIFIIVCCIVSRDNLVYDIGYGIAASYDHSLDFFIIGLILFVGVLAAFFSKYKIEVRSKNEILQKHREPNDDQH